MSLGAPRDPADPKGLIREAYRIDGITLSECRSIFMDWALSLSDLSAQDAIAQLIERHARDWPDHPMSQVLNDGLSAPARPTRRGGWRGRRPGAGEMPNASNDQEENAP